MSRIESALEQIDTARRYSLDLLNHVEPADWFRQPAEGVTHIAWQAGHLALCEHRLALVRVRGRQPGDPEFISDEYLSLFGKGSVPSPDPSRYPDPAELRRVLDRVHEQTLTELANLPDAVLDEPSEPQHPMFRTKLGALGWCAQHEFLHAGQIGLLRRLLGQEPLR